MDGIPLGFSRRLFLQVSSKAPGGRAQFDRWLLLFKSTVDEFFEGEKAEHIKHCAADMANVIHGKITGVQDARFDPANLTPEQRERYAKYRAQAGAATVK
jgi:hemoglobin